MLSQIALLARHGGEIMRCKADAAVHQKEGHFNF